MKKVVQLFCIFFGILLLRLEESSAQLSSIETPSLSNALQGQELIDSLLDKLTNANDDTTKVNALNTLCWELIMSNNYTYVYQYTQEAIRTSQKLNYTKGEAKALNNLGIYYQAKSNYSESFKKYYQSLKLNESIGYQKGIGFDYQCIGAIYSIQENYREASKNYAIALSIYEKINDKRGIAYIHSNLASCNAAQGKYAEALHDYEAALNIFRELGLKGGMCLQYNYMGDIYYKMNDMQKAVACYSSALDLSEHMGRDNLIVPSYVGLGLININQKNYSDARMNLNYAKSLLNYKGSRQGFRDVYAAMSKLDSVTGNWKDAYYNHLMFINYRDSLNNEKIAKKTVETQMQYAFDNKEAALKIEQEKKDARQRNILNAIVAGLAGSLLFLVVVFRQRNKVRKEKAKVEIEKARNEELLLNILPEEVANELKQTGGSIARQYNNVSVLFTDFVDFTGISAQLSPTELVTEIHKHFTAFDEIIEKHKLEKIKTIGDAYLAVAGMPNETPNHAQQVIKAALEIIRYIEESRSMFQIRIGINSGPVVAGIVGVKKFAYDIWGDAVNTANRMESLSEGGKINISGGTYELVKDEFDCTHRGKINVKGKGEIDMYYVVGPKK